MIVSNPIARHLPVRLRVVLVLLALGVVPLAVHGSHAEPAAQSENTVAAAKNASELTDNQAPSDTLSGKPQQTITGKEDGTVPATPGPVLQLVALLKYSKNGDVLSREYWTPAGQRVDDPKAITGHFDLEEGFCSGTQLRFLFLYDRFAPDCLGSLEVFAKQDEPVRRLFCFPVAATGENSQLGVRGMLAFRMELDPNVTVPSKVDLRLRYAVQPVEKLATFGLGKGLGNPLTDGVFLVALGETQEHQAFVTYLVKPETAAGRHLVVFASSKKGARFLPYMSTEFGEPLLPSKFGLVVTSQYREPLAQIAEFEIEAYQMRRAQFDDVELKPIARSVRE